MSWDGRTVTFSPTELRGNGVLFNAGSPTMKIPLQTILINFASSEKVWDIDVQNFCDIAMSGIHRNMYTCLKDMFSGA